METEDFRKVSGTVGAAAESWHGTLDRVSAKCNGESFLYIAVKLKRCTKSIIFCSRFGAEARSF